MKKPSFPIFRRSRNPESRAVSCFNVRSASPLQPRSRRRRAQVRALADAASSEGDVDFDSVLSLTRRLRWAAACLRGSSAGCARNIRRRRIGESRTVASDHGGIGVPRAGWCAARRAGPRARADFDVGNRRRGSAARHGRVRRRGDAPGKARRHPRPTGSNDVESPIDRSSTASPRRASGSTGTGADNAATFKLVAIGAAAAISPSCRSGRRSLVRLTRAARAPRYGCARSPHLLRGSAACRRAFQPRRGTTHIRRTDMSRRALVSGLDSSCRDRAAGRRFGLIRVPVFRRALQHRAGDRPTMRVHRQRDLFHADQHRRRPRARLAHGRDLRLSDRPGSTGTTSRPRTP